MKRWDDPYHREGFENGTVITWQQLAVVSKFCFEHRLRGCCSLCNICWLVVSRCCLCAAETRTTVHTERVLTLGQRSKALTMTWLL